MLNHISPFIYVAICNYVAQNELIDTLYNKGFIHDDDMYLPYYDDEDADDNQYGDFDTWITFSEIEKIVDLDLLIEKWVPHTHNPFGIWIGVSDTSSIDNFTKRVIEMIYDHEITDEELNALKSNFDVKI
jgi:hypothetical protein